MGGIVLRPPERMSDWNGLLCESRDGRKGIEEKRGEEGMRWVGLDGSAGRCNLAVRSGLSKS
jgi:hypothetical protein